MLDYMNLRKIAENAITNTENKTLSYTDELLRGILAVLLHNVIISYSQNSNRYRGQYGEDRFGNNIGSGGPYT